MFKDVHSSLYKVKTLKQLNDHKRKLIKYVIVYPYVGIQKNPLKSCFRKIFKQWKILIFLI